MATETSSAAAAAAAPSAYIEQSDVVVPEPTEPSASSAARTVSAPSTEPRFAASSFPDMITNRQGYSIFMRNWTPRSVPRAQVLVLHGLADHSGRYESLAQACVAAGYSVHALDHQGHGMSGPEERLTVKSYKFFIDDAEQWHDVVRGCMREAVQGARDIPCFVFGHSMGGALSIQLMKRLYTRPASSFSPPIGLMLSAPACSPGSEISSIELGLAGILGGLIPNKRLRRLPTSTLTTIEAEQKRAEADPLLSQAEVSLGLGAQVLQMIHAVWEHMEVVTFPVLLLQGEEDTLVRPAENKRWVEKLPACPDKQVRMFPAVRHEMLFDTNAAEFINTIIEWCDKHTAPK